MSWLHCTPYLKNLVKNHRAADKNGGMICQIYTNIKVHLQVPRVKGPSGFELEKNLKNEVIYSRVSNRSAPTFINFGHFFSSTCPY